MTDYIRREDAIQAIMDLPNCPNGYSDTYDKARIIAELEQLPSAELYTEDEIQKIQDLEQAEIQKAYELGRKETEPEIIRCKDCRWGKEVCGNIECFADTNVPPEYHGYEWFCPNGERR